MTLNVMALANRLQSESDAWLMLEELRWGDRPECPHCGCESVHYVAPTTGDTRKGARGVPTARRVWKCHRRTAGGCGKQFTVTVGTIFHKTHVPLRTWLFVVFEMMASKNGVAAREVERKYGLTNKTAWFMLHRVREAMQAGPLAEMMTGTVIADETYIGGSDRNKHRVAIKRAQAIADAAEPVPVKPGERMRGPKGDKTSVMSILDKGTGEVRSRVIPDVTGATLRKVIAEQVDMANTVLHTDEHASYKWIAPEMAGHESVNHSDNQYARYKDGQTITTNHLEGFFSQLKRSLDGTHHHVSVNHLPSYLSEFDYRYTTRRLSDTQRFDRLFGQVGRRLPYSVLTGR